jgi:isoleucyl-tRNA synthetase
MTSDYKSTLFLPQTDFPMKAGLPKKEPGLLERWDRLDVYGQHRKAAAGREKFILHDGPPYANGHIHLGTALNKVLKDVIVRSQQMMGKDANYVPGWDCHGLPIEWKIEEKYRKKGKNKDDVPVVQFRQECRDFAEEWIGVQRTEFQRLGCVGDWDNPYTTMNHAAEAHIVAELHKFLMNGGLYKGSKPVMWSVVEKTALAEAEVEYHDHTSTMVDVRFRVTQSPLSDLADASIVIWTTTPWTLAGNRGIAYGKDLEYVLLEVDAVDEAGSLAVVGERIALADGLLEEACQRFGITAYREVTRVKGSDFEGTVCAHPWQGQGYDFDVPLVPGFHVTTETGTGFVHIAPGHGAEDYEVGMEFKLPVPETVADGGTYYDHVPLLAGKHVYKVADEVVERLTDVGALLATGKLVHSYPHSWRSKAPLIFRNTPQWFISMDTNQLRTKAMEAIDNVRWVPPAGRNRIHAMVDNRPDWVVSRQRAWGVPITVFVDKKTNQPLQDEAVNQRIVDAVNAEGADAWFTSEPSRFLGPDRDPDDFAQVDDILDVWFDSGSTHAFVLEQRPDLQWPASLYLEGTDQHRGWFHSSLLESCGTRGRAPYDAVLTHGFVLSSDGRKMSKSLGNVVSPDQIVNQYGADILRLWSVSSVFTEDLRIGDEIIKTNVDAYRRLRNTLRFVLGNLTDFDDGEKLDPVEMPELDRLMLHHIAELDQLVRQCCDDYDFPKMFGALYNFCTVDLSAFYFDIRKDCLYCDGATSIRRRAVRTVLDQLFYCLTAWFGPILCYTAEEAWLNRFPSEDDSVHFQLFPEIPAEWRDDALAQKWEGIRALRRVVTGALEIERREKRIGASLQAAPVVYVDDDAYVSALEGIDLAEISITSGAQLVTDLAPSESFQIEDVPGVAVISALAEGEKCGRCWQVLGTVGNVPDYPDLCPRCAEAVVDMPATQSAE